MEALGAEPVYLLTAAAGVFELCAVLRQVQLPGQAALALQGMRLRIVKVAVQVFRNCFVASHFGTLVQWATLVDSRVRRGLNSHVSEALLDYLTLFATLFVATVVWAVWDAATIFPVHCYGFLCVDLGGMRMQNTRCSGLIAFTGLALADLINRVILSVPITAASAVVVFVWDVKWVTPLLATADFFATGFVPACCSICSYLSAPPLSGNVSRDDAKKLQLVRQRLTEQDISVTIEIAAGAGSHPCNASTGAQGCMYIDQSTLGLLDQNELEAVILHELGHIRHSHWRTPVMILLLVAVCRSGLCLALMSCLRLSQLNVLLIVCAYAFVRWILLWCLNTICCLVWNWAAHRDEYAADEFAVQCGRAQELCAALRRMESAHSRGRGGALCDMYALLYRSHPSTARRIEVIEKRA